MYVNYLRPSLTPSEARRLREVKKQYVNRDKIKAAKLLAKLRERVDA